ncbi:MAG TPA: DNA repair protein RecO [bacterium]|nr:DNA repair protein RecO [bacterium]
MQLVTSEAVILKRQDFKDSDLLVTFLARDKGRVTGIVKGSKKITGRGVGSFEPCMLGVMHYTEKPSSELVAIRKCDPRPPYLYLEQDYGKIVLASYLAELLTLCPIPESEAAEFYLLLARGLERVCEAGSPQQLALARLGFELDFLELLGLAPNWATCCQCGCTVFDLEAEPPRVLAKGQHSLDVAAGGVRCPACTKGARNAEPLSAGTLAFLALWRTARPSQPGAAPGQATAPLRPTRLALQELQQALRRAIVYHLEREPRSLTLLPSLEG